MTRPARIPIFLLDVVLFPGIPLPLHIFEERYKLMVHECMEQRREFGVVMTRGDGVAAVGCTAAILQIVKQYPDGRMDILTVGRTRFHMNDVFDEKPYLEAAVEYLEDDLVPEGQPAPRQLLQLFEQCFSILHGRAPQMEIPQGSIPIAFLIASELPLDLEYKQELLEQRSEVERQANLREKLEKWLPELEQLDRIKRRAGGNGHRPH
ncbi:MAG: LON peptidase substrate-binding domain-containing protein [Acidobacteria bacterium]|nr:LON peptidase substrate-binding domain-containing protein [Acidobacteriota bacterium]MCL5286607.1 LON peptidase substrate-binding domain-containing protein [Acidobacteriota bacterium]